MVALRSVAISTADTLTHPARGQAHSWAYLAVGPARAAAVAELSAAGLLLFEQPDRTKLRCGRFSLGRCSCYARPCYPLVLCPAPAPGLPATVVLPSLLCVLCSGGSVFHPIHPHVSLPVCEENRKERRCFPCQNTSDHSDQRLSVLAALAALAGQGDGEVPSHWQVLGLVSDHSPCSKHGLPSNCLALITSDFG